MPKKKSKTEKKDISKKDKILEEVAAKLKSIRDKDVLSEEDKADQDEEDEWQEEDTGIDLNSLREMEFSQFIGSSEPSVDRAPVLERLADFQPRPIFVGGIPQAPSTIPGEEEKTDEFKYVPGRTGNDEPKYIDSDSRISAKPTPVDLMKVGREQTGLVPQVDQEIFSMHSEPHSQIESSTLERAERAKRIDIERAGRRDPFEEDDAKYKNYKPKLPK